MTSQQAKNKRNGADYESALVKEIRSRGFRADRIRLSGKEDEGDIVIQDRVGPVAIIEAKAGKNIRPRAWYDDARAEAKNYALHRSLIEAPIPALAMKSHNRSIGQSLVTISLDDYLRLLGGSE